MDPGENNSCSWLSRLDRVEQAKTTFLGLVFLQFKIDIKLLESAHLFF